MTTDFDVDFLVVGGGSAGVRAARVAAGLGARTLLAEESRLGGTCVNVGCVPKKLMTWAAHYQHDFEDAVGFGWSVGETSFDWEVLRDSMAREIRRLNGIYDRLLGGAGVEVVVGRAVLVDRQAVDVGGIRYTAERILLAAGATKAQFDATIGIHPTAAEEFVTMRAPVE